MTYVSTIERVQSDMFPGFVAGLESEFGSAGIACLAAHFLEAEAADFHWEARLNERYLGSMIGVDEDDGELDRIAIIGFLAGRWFVVAASVDGDGAVHDMTGLQRFTSAWDAEGAFADLR